MEQMALTTLAQCPEAYFASGMGCTAKSGGCESCVNGGRVMNRLGPAAIFPSGCVAKKVRKGLGQALPRTQGLLARDVVPLRIL
jgi:hypothetical protein